MLIASGLGIISAAADERRFTYVYEPETLPQGVFEIENWVTLGAGRGQSAGQDNYTRWDLRQELEYGVTDWYAAVLYLNESGESYRGPVSGANEPDWQAWMDKMERKAKLKPDQATLLRRYLDAFRAGRLPGKLEDEPKNAPKK
jgi:hypothetical protein